MATYSIHVKRGEDNFGSSGISVEGIPYDYSQDDIDRLVGEALDMMLRAREQLLAAGKDAPRVNVSKMVSDEPKAKPDPFKATANRIVNEWTPAQKKEFNEVCIRAERDPIEIACLAHEECCTSYDEFILFAADGTKPKNAKPRLEVVK